VEELILTRKSIGFLVALLVLGSIFAVAQERPYTPEAGTPERKAIMDALRVPIKKQLKKDVIFKIDALKVQNGWAFVRGVPKKPDGGPMDYRGTVYAANIQAGVFDDWFCALLRKRGDQWQVVQYSIGATDVVWEGWDKQYHAPSAIFRE
jgi:hypothetical protein